MSELEGAWMLHKAMGKKQEIEVFSPSKGNLLNLFVCYKVLMFEKHDPSSKGQKINICLIFELKQEDQVNENSTC